MTNASTWLTLIRREWLQHRIGWLATLIAPAALMLLAAVFGQAQFDAEEQRDLSKAARQLPSDLLPGVVGVTVGGFTLYLVLAVVLAVLFLMANGLARKDDEDRSNEFWLSLPLSHNKSVGATLLAHGVALPLAGVLVGFVAALAAAMVVAFRAYGFNGVGLLFSAEPGLPLASMALRTLAGLPLALFWLAPIYLTLVAAGAWFKRWGLALVVGGSLFAHALVERFFESDIVANTIGQLATNAAASLVFMHNFSKEKLLAQFSGAELTSERVWHTLSAALQTLTSPLAVFALVVSAGMFWLIVLKRQRGA
jgi:ABC-2 type transport system permease protein